LSILTHMVISSTFLALDITITSMIQNLYFPQRSFSQILNLNVQFSTWYFYSNKSLTNIKTQLVQSWPPDLPTSQIAVSTAFPITFDGKLILLFAQLENSGDVFYLLILHNQFIRKSCWLYTQNISRNRPILSITTTMIRSESPLSLYWTTAIPS